MNKKTFLKIITFFVLMMALFTHSTAMSCTLTMGYRSSERLPVINKQPDNSGVYFDLFSTATKKLGCDFKVVRAPKKRILREIKSGKIDFYPGFGFSSERATYVYFIENGLPGGDIGLSHSDFKTIRQLNQLNGHTLIAATGAPDFVDGIEDVKTYYVDEMTVAKAIKLLQLKRADFFIYDKSTIEYFLKTNDVKDIKIHPDCCGVFPLYLGFSRASPNYKEIVNPEYDSSKPISVENFPTLISQDSLAYRFQQVLKNMKDSGLTDSIYNPYYFND